MDIRAGVIALAIFAVIGAYFAIRAAIKTMQTARKLSFYSLRKQHNASAWRLLFFALILLACAIWLPFYGAPLVYEIYPPSPTPSLTPTITLIPTITLTPSITPIPSLTNTPSITDTPTLTLTPFLPLAIEALFEGLVTPNPDAVFTAIQFSTEFDGTNAVNPKTVFELPFTTLYGGFDYNNTVPGTQWTALWYRSGQLVCYETEPWDGGTGGIGGYTDCTDPIGGWLAGSYEVQMFMGYEIKKIGRFVVQNNLATPTIIIATPGTTLTP